MNLTLVDQIANAVLYEGYLLYPYRASAVKNRQRWNFGTVYPEPFSAASGGTDACLMQTQCLVVGSEHSTLEIRARFLHLLAREVFELIDDGGSRNEKGGLRIEDGGLTIDDSHDSPSSILHLLSSILHLQSSILHPRLSVSSSHSISAVRDFKPGRKQSNVKQALALLRWAKYARFLNGRLSASLQTTRRSRCEQRWQRCRSVESKTARCPGRD